MKQKVKRLIQDLQEVADLLQHHGETTWACRLRDDLKRLRKHGRKALDDGLHLMRDADGLDGLRLTHNEGHLVSPHQEADLNDHLGSLKRAVRSTCGSVLAGSQPGPEICVRS